MMVSSKLAGAQHLTLTKVSVQSRIILDLAERIMSYSQIAFFF